MNLDSIINMITRIFVRKAINGGINKGIDYAARKSKPKGAAGMKTPGQVQADAAQAQKMREVVKNARKAARITRRLGR